MEAIRNALVAFLVILGPFLAIAQEPSVKIGFMLPLSGPAAEYGLSIQNGAVLAHEALPPTSQARIRLLFEDDQLQNRETANALNRLLTSNVDVLVSFAAAALVVAPVSEAKRIPHFAITSHSVAGKGLAYTMTHLVDSDSQAQLLVQELAKRNYRKIAMVMPQHETMLSLADKMKLKMPDARIALVMEENVLPAESDLRTIVSKIKKANPEGVVVGLLPGQLAAFAKSMKDQHVKVPLYGFGNFENEATVRAAEGGLEGAVYTVSAAKDEFERLYLSRFGALPILGAGNGYDIVSIVSEGTKNSSSRVELNEFFHRLTDHDGAMGIYSARGPTFTIPSIVKVIKHGKFKKQSP